MKGRTAWLSMLGGTARRVRRDFARGRRRDPILLVLGLIAGCSTSAGASLPAGENAFQYAAAAARCHLRPDSSPLAQLRCTGACRRPYAAGSPWNRPIGSGVHVDPRSSRLVSTLRSGPGAPLTSDPTQYVTPVYYVDRGTPRVPVRYSGWFSNVTGGGRGLVNDRIPGVGGSVRVPVPHGAVASAGYDANIIIINRDNGDEWDMHRFFGSRKSGYVAANVGHYNVGWSGVPPRDRLRNPWWLRGSGLPYLAGLVRPCEIVQGHIDHALAFAYPTPTPQHVYPASKSDGQAPIGEGMAEGTHLQLDPWIGDHTIRHVWHCTRICFIFAKALQKYGMFLADHSGHDKIPVEDDRTAHWRGSVTASTVTPIPVSAFRVVVTR